MNIFHIVNNKWVKKVVPSEKQTEEISANNKIKCDYCPSLVSDYLRIIDLFDYCCWNFGPKRFIFIAA